MVCKALPQKRLIECKFVLYAYPDKRNCLLTLRELMGRIETFRHTRRRRPAWFSRLVFLDPLKEILQINNISIHKTSLTLKSFPVGMQMQSLYWPTSPCTKFKHLSITVFWESIQLKVQSHQIFYFILESINLNQYFL
jgi:hypothetical protein